METNRTPITDREIETLAHAAGYAARPPKGGDIYYAFWDSEHCFLVCTPNWIRQHATAENFIALLEVERARPRFYR